MLVPISYANVLNYFVHIYVELEALYTLFGR